VSAPNWVHVPGAHIAVTEGEVSPELRALWDAQRAYRDSLVRCVSIDTPDGVRNLYPGEDDYRAFWKMPGVERAFLNQVS